MSSITTRLMFHVRHSTKLTHLGRKFHTSFGMCLDQNWRERKGLTTNPNRDGPLTTLPDYSFKDNRPVAYGSRQLRRIQDHQNYVKKIVQLAGEVDYAVERHAKLNKEKEAQRQRILDNKLKPKGEQLITSK